MSETAEFENPEVHTSSGQWVVSSSPGKIEDIFNADCWDLKIILTKKVKPFPDGTIIRATNVAEGLYHKLQGHWFVFKLKSPDASGALSYLSDSFFRDNGEKCYEVLYEPESN